MNEATNKFSGRRYRSVGVLSCSILPLRITATRSAIVIASIWSWVTRTVVMPSSACSRLISAAGLDAQARVQVAERLVQQQQIRLPNQRPAQRHPLLLTARQLRRPAAASSSPICAILATVPHPPVDLVLGRPPNAQRKRDVVVHRHVRDTEHSSGTPGRRCALWAARR